MRPLYLAAGHMLGSQPPSVGGTDLLLLLLAAGTGPYDRWSTNMTGGPVSFPNRTTVDRLLRAQIGPWPQAVIATPRPVPDMVTSIRAFVEGGR